MLIEGLCTGRLRCTAVLQLLTEGLCTGELSDMQQCFYAMVLKCLNAKARISCMLHFSHLRAFKVIVMRGADG